MPTVSPVNVAMPFLACTVTGKPGLPGSEIVTLPLNVVSTLWNWSSAETTTVKLWPAVTGVRRRRGENQLARRKGRHIDRRASRDRARN